MHDSSSPIPKFPIFPTNAHLSLDLHHDKRHPHQFQRNKKQHRIFVVLTIYLKITQSQSYHRYHDNQYVPIDVDCNLWLNLYQHRHNPRQVYLDQKLPEMVVMHPIYLMMMQLSAYYHYPHHEYVQIHGNQECYLQVIYP